MNDKVRVINKTGKPIDTEVIVDGNKLPLSHLMTVDVRIDPDNGVVAKVELKVDDLDILGNVVTTDLK